MTNTIKTWTVTLGGKTAIYEQDPIKTDRVFQAGTTMYREMAIFLDGLDKLRAAGAVIVEGALQRAY